jgi:CubicO group peptidase (beta-lactamase class C family)
MNDTGFYLPDEKAGRLVKVQQPVNGQWKHYPVTFYDPEYPIKGAKKFFAGGAGLSSTAKDYATFLQMYLNGGELNGVRLLSHTTVEAIMGNQVGNLFWDFGNYSGKHYGLAFSVVDQKGQDKGGMGSTGTFNWGGYFSTYYFADPKEKIVGTIMKNIQGAKSDNTEWKFQLLVGQAVDD